MNKKYMLLFFFLLFFLSMCRVGKINNVEINYGYSTIFNEYEIKSAVKTVLVEFREFKGCELKKIWYDENKSNKEIEDYLIYGKGSINKTGKNNIIVLLSDFYVDNTGGDGSFEPNSIYKDWNWILVRENETAKWEIDDWGY